MSDATRIEELEAEVARLRRILICDCGHTRAEHEDNDAPCFGGREGMEAGKGEYCMCNGFESDEMRSGAEPTP